MKRSSSLFVKVFCFSFLLCFSQMSLAQAPAYDNSTNTVYTGEGYEEFLKNESALLAINADDAYSSGESGKSYSGVSGKDVTIAVVDAGVSFAHSELVGKESSLQEEYNKYESKHGTGVAGLLLALKNSEGMHGLAYNAKLLSFSASFDGVNAEECGLSCLSTQTIWTLLAEDKFSDVKIINNSWGMVMGDKTLADYTIIKPEEGGNTKGQSGSSVEYNQDIANFAGIALNLVNQGKLIVAGAGNEASLNPSAYPAGLPYYDSALRNNTISVVAYDSSKMPSDTDFIADFSNLAQDAGAWTLAAPGVALSSPSVENEGGAVQEEASSGGAGDVYEDMNGTSAATPLVSGAAALVQEAFPYLNGKQLADVLFSTALKKENLSLSPYMVQNYTYEDEDGKTQTRTQVLIFTDNEAGLSYDTIVQNSGYDCTQEKCVAVTFEQVFGQGLLNVGDAIKGLATLDGGRLGVNDYDSERKQFLYSLDTQGQNSTWKNNISQTLREIEVVNPLDVSGAVVEELNGYVTDENGVFIEVPVGFKKLGEGVLTLTGASTFKGDTLVQGGGLTLSGASASMMSDVYVQAGTFSALENADLQGALNVSSGANMVLDTATLSNVVENDGTFTASNGAMSIAGEVNNTGLFKLSAGDLSLASDFTNKGLLSLDGGVITTTAKIYNSKLTTASANVALTGDFYNQASGVFDFLNNPTVTATNFQNQGALIGNGVISGVVNNTGNIATSVDVMGSLSSSGNIVLALDSSSKVNSVMSVGDLNITGGGFALEANTSYAFVAGQTYDVIDYSSLTDFSNFEAQTQFTDFISGIVTKNDAETKIQLEASYLKISEQAVTQHFLPEEQQVVKIIDKMLVDNGNLDFNMFYFLSADEIQAQVNQVREKATPIRKDQLPLAGTMATQIYSHLFQLQVSRNASSVPVPYRPSQSYQGGYSYSGRSGGNEATENKIWTQLLLSRVSQDAEKGTDLDEIRTKSYGAMFGYDHSFSDNHLIGFTGGFSFADLTQEENKTSVDDFRFGLYSNSRFGQVTLNAIAMAGVQKYNAERALDVAGVLEKTTADFDGYSAEFEARIGYDFMPLPYKDYSFYFQSFLGANVNYIAQDAYEEKGSSALSLGVTKTDDVSVSVQPGVTLGYTFAQAVVTLDLSYQRLLSGGSVSSSAYFLADEAKEVFDSLSAETDKDYLNFGMGLKSYISRKTFVNFWAGTRLSETSSALNLSATLAHEF